MNEAKKKARNERAEGLAPVLDLVAELADAVPLAGALVAIGKAGSNYMDMRFEDKLKRFVLGTGLAPKEVGLILKQLEEPESNSKIGQKVSDILAALTDDTRAEYLGNLLYAMNDGKLTLVEFQRCAHAISLAGDLDLRRFIFHSVEKTGGHHESYDYLVVAGLTANSGGNDGGAIVPTLLGRMMHAAINYTRSELKMPPL